MPHPELTALDTHPDRPNHGSLIQLHKEIDANASSIHSPGGDGLHGHPHLTISPAAYLLLTGVAHPVPQYPGAHPQHALGATAAVITENNRIHAANTLIFQTNNKTDNKLKQLILQVVQPMYFGPHDDPTHGFSNCTTLQLLDHLDTNYGTKSPDDLQRNDERMANPWDFSQPIETLWRRQELCMQYDRSIPANKAVRTTSQVLEQTELFQEDMKAWKRRPIAEQTMANLQSDFNLANTERLRLTTTANAGYHAANRAATEQAPNPPAHPPRGGRAPADVARALEQGELTYCWTHGASRGHNHTSATCTRPADNHNRAADLFNIMGGNPNIQSPVPRIHVPIQRNQGQRRRNHGGAANG